MNFQQFIEAFFKLKNEEALKNHPPGTKMLQLRMKPSIQYLVTEHLKSKGMREVAYTSEQRINPSKNEFFI